MAARARTHTHGGHQLLLLNGPPGCGKDAGVAALVAVLGQERVVHCSFKSPLILTACAVFGVSRRWWDAHYTRAGKEVPLPELAGRSPRQALIWVSETVLKPALGADIVGVAAARQVAATAAAAGRPCLFVFSDSGFAPELLPLAGLDMPLTVARLHREGCSWAGDSRAYISNEGVAAAGGRALDVDNNSTVAALAAALQAGLPPPTPFM